MASQLRQVLNHFQDKCAPLSINELAQHIGVEAGVLRGMLDYWVRKGKLRAVTGSGAACTTCGISGACPFVVTMPLYYEYVNEDAPPDDAACACGGHCSV